MRTPVRVAPLSALLLSCSTALLAAGPLEREGRARAVEALRADLGTGGDLRVEPRSGLVRFAAAASGRALRADGASPAERAQAFLRQHAAAFGLRGVDGELGVVRTSGRDATGIEVVRLRQLVRGVPVTGGEATVAVRGGGVVAAHARFVADAASVATTPRLAAGEAVERLTARNERWQWGDDVEWRAPRLEVFSRPHLGGADFPPRLAWFVEARKIDLRQFLWIDAESGIVLHRFSQLTDARDRKIYDGNNAAALPGTLKRSEGGAATLDADEDAAYDYSGDTYDYFSAEHGRDSYDDAGASLISTVDHCPSPGSCPYANAFWNGIQMVYGDGFPAADDVAAHELTHAVTEYTAGLFYYMQSGALNESYSDVFGETVDLINGAGNDAAGVRWLLGEDVPVFGAIRDMEDPNAFNNPERMSDPLFWCPNRYSSPWDNGGVHINSGVPNKAYSLLVDGGTFNSKTVTGIGATKAGKIWYRALANYLISSSNFDDADAALRQSCTDLIGTAGIVAGDCTELGDALDAVQMGGGWPCTPAHAEIPSLCPAGETAGAFLFREDVENPAKVSSDWTVTGTNGVWANQGFSLGTFATSGVESFWAYTPSGLADSSRAMNRDVKVVYADTQASFRHSFGFDYDSTDRYDGGVIERSSNGGGGWSDAGALIDAGATYGGAVSTCCGNALGGRQAFVRYSWGYTGTRLDLGSLTGSNFRLRFRAGTDTLFDDFGWFVDDVMIYRCFPDTLIFADGFEVGDRTEWSLSNP